MGRVCSLRLGLRSHSGRMSGSEAVRPAWGRRIFSGASESSGIGIPQRAQSAMRRPRTLLVVDDREAPAFQVG